VSSAMVEARGNQATWRNFEPPRQATAANAEVDASGC